MTPIYKYEKYKKTLVNGPVKIIPRCRFRHRHGKIHIITKFKVILPFVMFKTYELLTLCNLKFHLKNAYIINNIKLPNFNIYII